MRLVRQGITLIIVYSAFLTLTLELGLRLQNMSGEYDLHIWIHIGLLTWLWYNIYLIAYLISKNHIIGTMILISTQLGYLVSGMMMQFVGGVNLFNVIFDWKLVLAVNIGLGLIVLGITERKEWIK